ALVAGAFFLIGGWEWSAMMARFSTAARLLWCLSLALLMLGAEVFRPAWVLNTLPLWWLLALVAVLGYPRTASH
ncbi:MAG TPA: phosphatidate cytidylyltransferase, partial [Alcanivorax sp.]|nr:phosphatidate cytidylyltransferase [Alcanivorax sp.]